MADILEVIKARRSTRAFCPEQIDRAQLEQILEAGAWAPSGSGFQGWHFCALYNTEKVARLAEAVRNALPVAQDYNFYGAPTLIIVSYLKKHPHAWLDGSAAVENMLLAAQGLGLGSCWINQVRNCCDEPAVRALLNEFGVPDKHMVIACVALGHIAEPTPPKPRKEGVINIVE